MVEGMPMTRAIWLTGFLAITCLAGCAGRQGEAGGGPGDNDGDRYFSMGPGNAFSLKLEGQRLFGPDLDVVKTPEGYRGQLRGKVIDLRLEGGRITGTIGGDPFDHHTDLHVEQLPDGVLVQGIFADGLTRLEFGPDRLKGNIGNISYDLIRHDMTALRYESRSRQGWLDLPSSLIKRPVDEQVLWLMLFLTTSTNAGFVSVR
jgi:hypothetical protein